jgi:four helix bundle protein
MTFKRFEDIIAWQLADQLRKEVIAASDRGPFAKDYRLRSQIRDAANSGSSNIAEGFKRFNPGEFAQFVKYSRASLAEMKNHLYDAKDRGHINEIQYATMTKLAARAAIAAARLHAYLRTAKPPRTAKRPGNRKKD